MKDVDTPKNNGQIHRTRSNMIMTTNGAWPSTHVTLIEKIAKSADAEAWEYFYNVYSPLIFRLCRRQHLQPADAEDVCQKIIVSMRLSLPNYAAARGRFRCWFARVIQRQIAKHLKRETRKPIPYGSDIVDAIPVAFSDVSAEDEVRRYIVTQALEAIRPDFELNEWIVMEEVVLKGRKPRDLAAEKGWGAPWISKAKYRLVKRLKEKVYFLDNGDMSNWQAPVNVLTDRKR